jgi:hypothetical protein
MKIKSMTVMLLLFTVIATGSMEARVPQYCNTALNMCLSWCQTYFQGDGGVDQGLRNGCRAGCLAGYAECVLSA